MDLSDGHINPWQLHLVPANPPLTQMHAHTKTQTNTVRHHVTVLCNAAKALNTAYGSSSASRVAHCGAGVYSASERGRVECVCVCLCEDTVGKLLLPQPACWGRSTPGRDKKEQRGFTGILLPGRKS